MSFVCQIDYLLHAALTGVFVVPVLHCMRQIDNQHCSFVRYVCSILHLRARSAMALHCIAANVRCHLLYVNKSICEFLIDFNEMAKAFGNCLCVDISYAEITLLLI